MKTKSKRKLKGVGNITVRSKSTPAKKRGKTIKLISRQPGGTEILLTSLAIGITGALGYFGWQYYKKTKGGKTAPDKLTDELTKIHLPPKDAADEEPKEPAAPKVKTRTTKTASAGFPLKKGSKGEQVRQMQQALIDKYGKSILPKYGADGDFGTETLTALKSKGYPAVIDESAYNVITGGGKDAENTSEIVGLAEKLYRAAGSKSISNVLALLKTIRDKDHYQQVSNTFMQYRLNGVRKTLVTGLLDSFPTETYKQQIRTEFLRMGLHYDGSKWSLSGFGGQTIVTIEPSKVWASATQSMDVPANMVLGTEIAQKLDFTLFENNKKYFLIKTSAVKYFE